MRSVVIASLLVAACGQGSDDAASSASDVSGSSELISYIGAPTQSGPAFSNQLNPALAAGKNGYLAVWSDNRNGTTTIQAARLGADGSVLDDRSITLSTASTSKDSSPAVAFDGTNWLVVWQHGTTTASQISAVRVDSDGHVLDATPIAMSRKTDLATAPAVAWSGSEFVVVWRDNRDRTATDDRSEVYSARVSSAGALNGAADGARLSNAPGGIVSTPTIARNGDSLLVAWDKKVGSGRATVGAALVSNTATPLAFGDAANDNLAPSITSDGTNFLVTWAAGAGVVGTRVSSAGAKLEDTPISIAATGAAPSATFDGDAFAVAWSGGALRVGKDGTVGASLPGASGTGETRPAIASFGSATTVLRTNNSAFPGLNGISHVLASSYPKTGGAATKADVAVARGDSAQRGLVTAFDGANYMAVWLDYHADAAHPEVWSTIYGANGGLVNPAAKRLDVPGAAAVASSLPAVTFDGANYVVAWQTLPDGSTQPSTSFRHVDKTGEPTDQPTSMPGGRPGLASGGGKTVLSTDSGKGWTIGAGLSASSAPLFTRTVEAAWTVGPVAFAFDGQRFVNAWVAYHPAAQGEIHVQRFLPTGAPFDNTPVVLGHTSATTGVPSIAASTNGHGSTLVAWDDANGKIFAARAGATMPDTNPPNLVAGFAPRLTWDGTEWLVAYQKLDTLSAGVDGSELDLAYMKSGSTLSINGTAGVLGTGFDPSIAGGANGDTFIAFEGFGNTSTAAPRTSMALLADPAPPPPPPSGTSSSSGGTTAPAGDDDDDSSPVAPKGDDDDDNKTPARPKAPTSKPIKAATVAPPKKDDTGAADDGGGCSTVPGSSSDASSVLVAIGALSILVRRRRRLA